MYSFLRFMVGYENKFVSVNIDVKMFNSPHDSERFLFGLRVAHFSVGKSSTRIGYHFLIVITSFCSLLEDC